MKNRKKSKKLVKAAVLKFEEKLLIGQWWKQFAELNFYNIKKPYETIIIFLLTTKCSLKRS